MSDIDSLNKAIRLFECTHDVSYLYTYNKANTIKAEQIELVYGSLLRYNEESHILNLINSGIDIRDYPRLLWEKIRSFMDDGKHAEAVRFVQQSERESKKKHIPYVAEKVADCARYLGWFYDCAYYGQMGDSDCCKALVLLARSVKNIINRKFAIALEYAEEAEPFAENCVFFMEVFLYKALSAACLGNWELAYSACCDMISKMPDCWGSQYLQNGYSRSYQFRHYLLAFVWTTYKSANEPSAWSKLLRDSCRSIISQDITWLEASIHENADDLPGDFVARISGNTYMQLGLVSQARAALEYAVKDCASDVNMALFAEFLLETGQIEQAETVFSGIEKSRTIEAVFFKTKLLVFRKEYADAIEYVDSFTEYSDTYYVLLQKSFIFEKMGKYDDAINSLQSLKGGLMCDDLVDMWQRFEKLYLLNSKVIDAEIAKRQYSWLLSV